jgi:hypothetical protein
MPSSTRYVGGMSEWKCEWDAAAHPEDLALIVLCDHGPYVLDADDFLIGKHLLLLWWESPSWFACFLLVPMLFLAPHDHRQF